MDPTFLIKNPTKLKIELKSDPRNPYIFDFHDKDKQESWYDKILDNSQMLRYLLEEDAISKQSRLSRSGSQASAGRGSVSNLGMSHGSFTEGFSLRSSSLFELRGNRISPNRQRSGSFSDESISD